MRDTSNAQPGNQHQQCIASESIDASHGGAVSSLLDATAPPPLEVGQRPQGGGGGGGGEGEASRRGGLL